MSVFVCVIMHVCTLWWLSMYVCVSQRRKLMTFVLLQNYIQIIGIIVGMLLFGALVSSVEVTECSTACVG
jgi:hypothetical protein